jgi:hypothetical protein
MKIVTGSSSGTTGRVKSWNSTLNLLEVYAVTGDFSVGETIIVGSSSGASHQLRLVNLDPVDDGFQII